MAFSTVPPRSQYNRNLTFRLSGGGETVTFTFPIKPSEFQLEHPARVTTTQTLQGVYQDFGGLGVKSITYQGSTGWRRRALSDYMDGYECFQFLYKKIYMEYHKRISASTDPSTIECLVMDDLYEEVYRVSLDDFKGSKSKASPLLYSYVIPMTVQSESATDRGAADLTDISLPSTALNPDYAPIVIADAVNSIFYWDVMKFRQYTVQSGDNLESISYLYYGTRNRAVDIANANGIQPPYMFDPNIILFIPW